MNTEIILSSEKEITIQVKIPIGGTMLESEELIQKAVNAIGNEATSEILKRFDTDGSPIIIGGIKFTSKRDKVNKEYETPYGKAFVERYVYQTSKGGKTFCPLDTNARIIHGATPLFSKILSSKYSEHGANHVIRDLEENHGRKISKSYIQNVVDTVGSIALAKEENWHYETPTMKDTVSIITIGLDGTCMYISNDGFRQAMVGTIALYNCDKERLHTTYIAASPEYGKKTFIKRFENEIDHIKKLYPDSQYIGIADGAHDNWSFLKKHTEHQVLDFYHAAEYVSSAAEAAFGKKKLEIKKKWIYETCHDLKHMHGGADETLLKLKKLKIGRRLSDENKVNIDRAIKYFGNHLCKMNYAENIENKIPIGSGVTEAACKVIIKQRMCCSGMKWKDRGARAVLSLRTLNYSTGRWNQFWSKISQYGVPCELPKAA